MFSFYFNFIINVSSNIWYSINLAILLVLKPVYFLLSIWPMIEYSPLKKLLADQSAQWPTSQ